VIRQGGNKSAFCDKLYFGAAGRKLSSKAVIYNVCVETNSVFKVNNCEFFLSDGFD